MTPLSRLLLRSVVGAGLSLVLAPILLATGPHYTTPYSFTTFAGRNACGYDDGPATLARLYDPRGIAVDNSGTIYVADSGNFVIRKITPDGNVSTLAGLPGERGKVDGPGTTARFIYPAGMLIDPEGNLFVADIDANTGSTIRKITPQGKVTTLAIPYDATALHTAAGIISAQMAATVKNACTFDTGNDNYTEAGILQLTITADRLGNVYAANRGSLIRITPSGETSVVAGRASNYGWKDALGTEARFGFFLTPIATSDGNLLVADHSNGKIRLITPDGTVSTLADLEPSVPTGGILYPPPNNPRWSNACALDRAGNLFVATHSTIRKVTSTGAIINVAGAASEECQIDIDGDLSRARFTGISDISIGPGGDLFVADSEAHTIRKITPAGIVTTLAGRAGVSGSADGTGSAARFNKPKGIAVDSAGTIYVADSGNYTIRMITPAGAVTTLAGTASRQGLVDGVGSAARFNNPSGIMIDNTGAVLVADGAIRRITPAGLVTSITQNYPFNDFTDVALDSSGNLLVGSKSWIYVFSPAGVFQGKIGAALMDTTPAGHIDGNGSDGTAKFSEVRHLLVDTAGSVYLSDDTAIRRMSSDRFVTTLGGLNAHVRLAAHSWSPSMEYGKGSTNGIGRKARFASAQGLALDPTTGTLYVADGAEIRKGQYVETSVSIGAQPLSQSAEVGGTMVFSVVADGAPAPTYQWYFNGTAISGATAAALKLPGVTPANAGKYTVVITNSSGSVTSQEASLTVTDPEHQPPIPPPPAPIGNPSYPQPYYFTTLAGQYSNGLADGTTAARFNYPLGLAVDSVGNAYVTDTLNHTIRKVTPAGIVSTLAGLAGHPGRSDGTGGTARFNGPENIVIDADGNLFVEDRDNQCIRKITPDGAVTTIAGQATLINLYASAKRITPNMATTLDSIDVKNGLPDYGPEIDNRQKIAIDGAGNAYVSYLGTVRKVTPSGQISTLAGAINISAHVDGTGAAARFSGHLVLTADAAGNVYVAEFNGALVRKITPGGEVTTLAGAYYERATVDGIGAQARFCLLMAIAVDTTGNVLVVDNNTVRRVSTDSKVVTLAGFPADQYKGHTDASGPAARFQSIGDVAVAPSGEIYVADSSDHTIRKVSTSGAVTTIAGLSGQSEWALDGSVFRYPGGVAVDATGNVYVADTGFNVVRKITAAGKISILAGKIPGTSPYDESNGNVVFTTPTGIDVDSAGTVYVADGSIRKITPDGDVTTLAISAASADNPLPTGRFSDLEVDSGGTIFACGPGYSVTKITPAGKASTLAGNPEIRGYLDATGVAARFGAMAGIAVDKSGNVYVGDADYGIIRRIAPDGVVTTIGGLPAPDPTDGHIRATAEGTGSKARFTSTCGLAVDDAGTLYFGNDSTLTRGQLAGPVTITTQPQSASATGGTAVQFSVTATGVPAPSYQWRFNGTPISGATAATLHLPAVSTANAGDYTVVATNDLGSATSSAAALTVSAAPVTPTTPSTPSSGGGGALGLSFALGLLALGSARRRSHRSAQAC